MRYSAFLVLLGLFIGTQAASFQDLLDALNTTEKSWLTRRTYTYEQHTCVYTLMKELTNTEYKFEQGFKKGSQAIQHTLHAKLGEDKESDPWMEVSSKPDQAKGIKYYLKFWNKEEKCGILKVHLSGRDQYEMHVWDSKVDEPASQCESQYKALSAGKESYDVYSSSCKSRTKVN